MKQPQPIKVDGRTGEGGGQLVRIAVALSAITSQPILIEQVRGNRDGARGGGAYQRLGPAHVRTNVNNADGLPGLKSQHVTSIQWLAAITDAECSGLAVGSKTLAFRPRRGPALAPRGDTICIRAESPAASALLIMQAILPFLVFASPSKRPSPLRVEIEGGTNVPWSPSFEFADQVLFPALADRFGIIVERRLLRRGWTSASGADRGAVSFIVHPLPLGTPLRPLPRAETDDAIVAIDATLILPADLHAAFTAALAAGLAARWPAAKLCVCGLEDSGRDARVYVLLVARSGSSRRWGSDTLTSVPKKTKPKERDAVAEKMARDLVRRLVEEVDLGGDGDVHLQDQLVVFQALAEGTSGFARQKDLEEAVESLSLEGEERRRRDKMHEPFGQGSTHAQTARWITAELLPRVGWYNKGTVCEGVGFCAEPGADSS